MVHKNVTNVSYPQAPQPQPAQKESGLNWAVITIISSIIVLILIIAITAYWFFVLRPLVEPQPIPKTINQVDTSDPKIATKSSTATDTSNWQTYTGKLVKISFKLPLSWKVEETEGAKLQNKGKINTSINAEDVGTARFFSITKNFYGGFEEIKKVSESNYEVAGRKTKKIYFTDRADEKPNQFQANLKVDKNTYLIIAGWDVSDIGAEETLDTILSTLKFPD